MEAQQAPKRNIGLIGATLINLNGVVGAGIFALPALLYAGAGGYAPLLILAFAFLVAAPSLVYAKLSTMFDQSGGAQLYAEKAFGPFAGFQAGWCLLGQNLASRAANFHVLVSYLAAIFPLFDTPVMKYGTILALIILATGLSLSGTRRSIGALWIGTALKLGPILLICAVGLFVNGVPTNASFPQFTEVESIALLMAYAFSGGALSAIAAGEVRDARRTIYRSIMLNLVVIALLYALVQWAYIAIDPQDVNMERPLASAGEAVFGQWGIILISIAAIFSTGTNQLSYFISMPRLIFAMSQQGLLPRIFSGVSSQLGTPVNAIITYGIMVALLALSGTFETLAVFMVALESLVSLIVIAGLAKFWIAMPTHFAGSTRAIWPLIMLIATAFTIWLMLQISASSILPTLGTLLIGSLFYFLARRQGTPSGQG